MTMSTDPVDADALVRLLGDPDGEVRARAAQSLAQLDDPIRMA
jgi:HEAT repeat protein